MEVFGMWILFVSFFAIVVSNDAQDAKECL